MIQIIVAGDFCMHHRMQQFDSNKIVATTSSVIPIIQNADYALVNLECAIFESNQQSIVKSGPNLHNSSESIKAIKELGFKGVTLANNHFADYGLSAVSESLRLLEEYGIDYYGGGSNIIEASKVKYTIIKNKTIAIINSCEHEFSIATAIDGGANPLDVVDMTRAIKEARLQSDCVIVIIHGGVEHYDLPTVRMQKWYRFFIESGADAVINHHQHCYSGYEFYHGKPIVYGLGNFCFDWNGMRNSKWNEGYMVQLNIGNSITLQLIPYKQCDDQVGTFVLKERNIFDKRINELNSIIMDSALLQQKFLEFVMNKAEDYLYLFNNPQNRILRRLNKHGLLPIMFASEVLPKPIYQDKDKLLALLNDFQCEAHSDVMKVLLTQLRESV